MRGRLSPMRAALAAPAACLGAPAASRPAASGCFAAAAQLLQLPTESLVELCSEKGMVADIQSLLGEDAAGSRADTVLKKGGTYVAGRVPALAFAAPPLVHYTTRGASRARQRAPALVSPLGGATVYLPLGSYSPRAPWPQVCVPPVG